MANKSFQFDTGIDLGPFFTKSLIEAIEPKGTRKQRQEQAALATLAELQPMVSKLPESEKKDFYNRFFRSFGVYKAPWIRGIFGAGDEPILPLPEGSREESRYVTGPLGIGGRMQKQYIIPQMEPYKFAREQLPPLMPPERVAELKSFGLTDADVRDLLKEQPSILKMVMSASRIYNQAKSEGKSHEEALNTLGELRVPYEDYLADRQLKKQSIESGIRAKEEHAELGKEREKRLGEEGRARTAFHQGQLAIAKDREARLSKNSNLADGAKNQKDLLSLAQKAFSDDRRMAISHNRLELDKQVKAQMMGETYIRNDIPIPLDFEDWLDNDGRAFKARFQQLGGEAGVEGEGAIPQPPPVQRKSKVKTFEGKYSL